MAVRTYIDTGVLIAAATRDKENIGETALSFLYDPLREYVTSDYVKVELLPKCTFHREEEERQFYEDFFKRSIHVPSSDDLLALAIEEGCKTGISGIDAIHVACAIVAEATELITSERPTKPIHRANGITVISIRPTVSKEDFSTMRKNLPIKLLRSLLSRLQNLFSRLLKSLPCIL